MDILVSLYSLSISGFIIPYSVDGVKFPESTLKFFSRRF